MANLLSFATDLAKNPPTEVYQTIMNWYAKAADYPDFSKVWQEKVDTLGEDGAKDFVGCICDMTAMCMMMTAAGVKRIEAMKTDIRVYENKGLKNVPQRVTKDMNSLDQVYFFSRAKAANFKNTLMDWCKSGNHGIAQFKFPAEGDWHTLAVERIGVKEVDDDTPRFIVYQAYQNTYRLKDFLGQGTEQEQRTMLERVWKSGYEKAKENGSLKQYPSQKDFTDPVIPRIASMAKGIGGGFKLGMGALVQDVLNPLYELLAGGVNNKTWVDLTASNSSKETVSTDYMALLVCNLVDPNAFKANYNELRASKNVTMYPDFC